MTEVRARAARHKGQMNFEAESKTPQVPKTPCKIADPPQPSKPSPLRLRRRQRALTGDGPRPRRNRHGLHHRDVLRRREIGRVLRPLQAQGRRLQVCDPGRSGAAGAGQRVARHGQAHQHGAQGVQDGRGTRRARKGGEEEEGGGGEGGGG